MVSLNTVGIAIDKGVIPLNHNKQRSFSLNSLGIAVDKGTIPPKNYYQGTVVNIGLAVEPTIVEISYQVLLI